MPQTIDLVVFEKSGRSKLYFLASPLTVAFVLDKLSDVAESSPFYNKKIILEQISLRQKNKYQTSKINAYQRWLTIKSERILASFTLFFKICFTLLDNIQ